MLLQNTVVSLSNPHPLNHVGHKFIFSTPYFIHYPGFALYPQISWLNSYMFEYVWKCSVMKAWSNRFKCGQNKIRKHVFFSDDMFYIKFEYEHLKWQILVFGNLHAIHEVPLYGLEVRVWCVVCAQNLRACIFQRNN